MVIVGACVVAAVGIHLWNERVGTTPRHALRAENIAMCVSFAIACVLPLLPSSIEPSSFVEASLTGGPLVLAGLWILCRR